jgi:hypothetical protein
MKSNHLSDQQVRWAAYLTLFNFVIKHIPRKLNPADPATRQPDFLPNSEESKSDRQLLVESLEGLKLKGQEHCYTNFLLDLGEVSTVTEPPTSTPIDTDFFFCPPLAELIRLLKKAYKEETPDADKGSDLKQLDNLWWMRS